MKTFIGTKIIFATPMTRAEYNTYRDWTLPENENGADEGMLVEYEAGGQQNDSRHQGYISWSPKSVFDLAYKATTAMGFGEAIVMLKQGYRVARSSWNGKGMWLVLTPGQVVPAHNFWNEHNRMYAHAMGGFAEVQPYITMKTAQDTIVPWLASQSDILDEDWTLVL